MRCGYASQCFCGGGAVVLALLPCMQHGRALPEAWRSLPRMSASGAQHLGIEQDAAPCLLPAYLPCPALPCPRTLAPCRLHDRATCILTPSRPANHFFAPRTRPAYHILAPPPAFPPRRSYDAEGQPSFASARLWDDGVIDPADTRTVLGLSLAAALNVAPGESRFGVFRM